MPDEPSLFESTGSDGTRGEASGQGADPVGGPGHDAPLAARMRPRTPEEFHGQEQLLGEGRPLRLMLEGGELQSCILWGPTGSGKTTIARLLARTSEARFESFSAVTEGVARVREIIAHARALRSATGRGTILFCDEIHRFNRAQQDAFLPHVEDGTIVLVGATTENPSFEVNRPLLSRAPVFILEALSEDALRGVLVDALANAERGLGGQELDIDDEALAFLARASDGDARRALGALESAARLVGEGGHITVEVAGEALQHRFAIYDKSGEEHFNLISALHKSIRGSDPDATLYWLARMLGGGEDPRYVARRLVRMASEDIGLADPQALSMALAAWRAFDYLGAPEGELALAEAAVYLATAPKSNRVYAAWKQAARLARDTASAPVPLHIRNAPTAPMKEWGYGKGYEYEPDLPDGVSTQPFLPEELEGSRIYRPGRFGFERDIDRRLQWWEQRRSELRAEKATDEPGPD